MGCACEADIRKKKSSAKKIEVGETEKKALRRPYRETQDGRDRRTRNPIRLVKALSELEAR